MNRRLLLGFALLLLLLGSASGSLTDDLQSYWTFNLTFTDALGVRNWSNSGMENTSGVIGNATLGNAGTMRAETTRLDMSSNAFAIAAWMKVNTSAATQPFFSQRNSGASVNNWLVRSTSNSKCSILLWGSSSFSKETATGCFDDNVWTHYVFQYDGSNLSVWKNGTLFESWIQSQTLTDGGTGVTLRINNDHSTNYGRVSYDEVAVYNRTLNSTEVSALYNSGSGLSYPFSSEPEPDYVEVVLTTANGTGSWSVPDGVSSVDVLVVGGGGGAGKGTTTTTENGGGGGAGGLIFIEDYDVTGYGGTISYSVGAGGSGSTSTSAVGSSGSNTAFGSLTALGGGGGGSASLSYRDATNGGSGGGGGILGGNLGDAGTSTQTSTNDGYTSSGYGNNGDSATSATGVAGGGGGAGGVAVDDAGGAGMSVFGSVWATGGSASSDGSAGAANTGSGGNAAATNSASNGGAGAGGVIVIRYTVSPVLTIMAEDAYDASSLSNISVNLTNATGTYPFSTTSGTVTTSIDYTTAGLFDISISSNDSGGYFTRLYEDVNVSTGVFTAELVQAYASFSCFELYTNDTLTCAQPGPHIRQADSYTDDVNVTGYYPVSYSYTLSALDNETFNVEGFYDHELTINASDYEGNALTNFTLSVESTLSSFNVTDNNTGTVVLPLLQGYVYNVTITQNVPEGEDRNNSIETETFNVTTSSESYQFNLTFPRLFINIYDEQTNLFVEDTTTITFSKGNESFSLNTTTGRLNLTGLEAIESGEYSVLFENSAYNPRTYDLTYNRTYAQTLNAYLVPLEAPSTIFTIEDSQSRSPVEGATVTIQRYVNGTLTTVLSLESDITGRVGFDYIPDRQYEFEITMTGYETRSFTLNPILFSSYTILLEPSISFGEIGGDFSGVSIIFSTNRYTESQTNNLTLSFSDPAGGLVSYGYNVSTATTGQLTSQSGSNAYGSILPSSFAIPDVPLYDQVRVDYYYERSDGVVRTFTTSYSITQVNAYQNQTWVNNRQIAENIAPLDRAAIVVIGTGALSALAYTFVGLGGASLSAIVLLGFFAYSGFINGWIVAISIIGFMFLLLGRGSQ